MNTIQRTAFAESTHIKQFSHQSQSENLGHTKKIQFSHGAPEFNGHILQQMSPCLANFAPLLRSSRQAPKRVTLPAHGYSLACLLLAESCTFVEQSV
jgi:hypothetical protein